MAAVWATARRELDDGHNLTCSVRGEQLATEAVCLALAEILLDPLTVEGGEDGRWRARSLSGDATMRIAAFPAKIARLGGCGRLQRGVAALAAMWPMLGRTTLLYGTLRTVVRTAQPLFSSSAIQLPARRPDPPVTRTRPRWLEDLGIVGRP
jgi:hypothetical protein